MNSTWRSRSDFTQERLGRPHHMKFTANPQRVGLADGAHPCADAPNPGRGRGAIATVLFRPPRGVANGTEDPRAKATAPRLEFMPPPAGAAITSRRSSR